jgi:catechol 2,3-dioxygenase-like lactoylglutathione lyase family enzyme
LNLSSFYPVICAEDVAGTPGFYREHFGFSPVFESDWYVSLRQGPEQGYELAILDPRHQSIPDGLRVPTRGLILNFEVADAYAEHQRLVVENGLTVVLSLTSEAFGQRHFIVIDPNGILIDVIEPIAPSAEFAQQYMG